MKRCQAVQRALAEGQSLHSEPIAAHLRACDACRVLAAEEGALGRALSDAREGEGQADPSAMKALFERVEAALEGETGPRAWLRSRATPVRIALALSAVAIIGAGTYLAVGRVRLQDYPLERFGLVMGALLVVLVVAVVVGLRPLYEAPVPRWQTWMVVSVALALPVGLAIGPHTSGPSAFAFHALGPDAFGCLVTGSVLALPVLLLWQGLRRVVPTSSAQVLLGAAVAGLVGNVALQCQCPAVAPPHLMWGHAGVVILFLAGGALWAAARRRSPA